MTENELDVQTSLGGQPNSPTWDVWVNQRYITGKKMNDEQKIALANAVLTKLTEKVATGKTIPTRTGYFVDVKVRSS